MTFSMKRVLAILKKDYKDISRNLYITTTLILPPVMALLANRTEGAGIDMYYMLISMALVLVGAYIQASLIAEEKEKNTLRGLMLSPASTFEIFAGKSLLSLLGTIAIVTLTIKLTDYRPQNIPIIIVALLLSAIFYLGIGTLIGLFTKSVIEASVVILPVVFLFSFGSFITTLIEKYTFLSFAEYLPNLQLVELAKRVENGDGISEVAVHLGVLLIWAIAIHLLAIFVYKKRMVDD